MSVVDPAPETGALSGADPGADAGPDGGGAVGPRARRIADHAVRALIEEVVLTPKPGLVDRRGGGAHPDMDLDLMERSAEALRPAFALMVAAAEGRTPGEALRRRLGAHGRRAEQDMLRVTGGVNTHRGAIWALGLLVAATALHPDGTPAHDIARSAGRIARIPDPVVPAYAEPTHGERARARYGLRGARGEAADGFPTLVWSVLPVLRISRAAGVDEEHARLDALVGALAVLDDTCLAHRGGLAALRSVQRMAAGVLEAGGTSTAAGYELFTGLDDHVRRGGLSPGGSADLLAAALFLDRVAGPGAHRRE
ncbi:triphosphoribosyl-dephospho-CoA synthase [Nocardiopsis mwathae]|uniref:triphosphoribosyl-dephospho-CoA synthase n=1 Tax=Nocardiopsis mwathae TaxID=1472723 RepID=A0A7X0D5V5_9ACTN|nr:triphosphoribosyl-dephospho-CoA synthase [Nocardiopsis mwathae]MBB6171484.1 triphosphoribosyl-dephospho-CoA synthase [Nocardiopsis mwathae]